MYIGSSSFLRTDLRIWAAALVAVATVVGVDSQYLHTGLTEVLDTWLRIQYQSVIGLCVAPPLPKNIKHIAILLIILALACVAAVKLQKYIFFSITSLLQAAPVTQVALEIFLTSLAANEVIAFLIPMVGNIFFQILYIPSVDSSLPTGPQISANTTEEAEQTSPSSLYHTGTVSLYLGMGCNMLLALTTASTVLARSVTSHSTEHNIFWHFHIFCSGLAYLYGPLAALGASFSPSIIFLSLFVPAIAFSIGWITVEGVAKCAAFTAKHNPFHGKLGRNIESSIIAFGQTCRRQYVEVYTVRARQFVSGLAVATQAFLHFVLACIACLWAVAASRRVVSILVAWQQDRVAQEDSSFVWGIVAWTEIFIFPIFVFCGFASVIINNLTVVYSKIQRIANVIRLWNNRFEMPTGVDINQEGVLEDGVDNLITAMKRFIRLGVDALSQHQKGGLQSVSALLQQNMVSVLQTVLGLGAMDWTHAFNDIRKTSLRATVCIKLPVHVETPTVVDRFCLTVYDENPDSTDPGDRVPVMCINCNRIELAAGQKELVIAPQIVISAELFEPWLKALWKNFTGNNGKAASYLDAVQETVAYSCVFTWDHNDTSLGQYELPVFAWRHKKMEWMRVDSQTMKNASKGGGLRNVDWNENVREAAAKRMDDDVREFHQQLERLQQLESTAEAVVSRQKLISALGIFQTSMQHLAEVLRHEDAHASVAHHTVDATPTRSQHRGIQSPQTGERAAPRPKNPFAVLGECLVALVSLRIETDQYTHDNARADEEDLLALWRNLAWALGAITSRMTIRHITRFMVQRVSNNAVFTDGQAEGILGLTFGAACLFFQVVTLRGLFSSKTFADISERTRNNVAIRVYGRKYGQVQHRLIDVKLHPLQRHRLAVCRMVTASLPQQDLTGPALLTLLKRLGFPILHAAAYENCESVAHELVRCVQRQDERILIPLLFETGRTCSAFPVLKLRESFMFTTEVAELTDAQKAELVAFADALRGIAVTLFGPVEQPPVSSLQSNLTAEEATLLPLPLPEELHGHIAGANMPAVIYARLLPSDAPVAHSPSSTFVSAIQAYGTALTRLERAWPEVYQTLQPLTTTSWQSIWLQAFESAGVPETSEDGMQARETALCVMQLCNPLRTMEQIAVAAIETTPRADILLNLHVPSMLCVPNNIAAASITEIAAKLVLSTGFYAPAVVSHLQSFAAGYANHVVDIFHRNCLAVIEEINRITPHVNRVTEIPPEVRVPVVETLRTTCYQLHQLNDVLCESRVFHQPLPQMTTHVECIYRVSLRQTKRQLDAVLVDSAPTLCSTFEYATTQPLKVPALGAVVFSQADVATLRKELLELITTVTNWQTAVEAQVT